jgi:hypothetical protein
MSHRRTLARKLEAVHRKTVARSKMIPSICRHLWFHFFEEEISSLILAMEDVIDLDLASVDCRGGRR